MTNFLGKVLRPVLCLVAVSLAAECNSVAVSLAPYAKILSEIGRGKVCAVQLVPAGADPHTFEPKPQGLKEFSKAGLYLSDGSGIDKAWLPRFRGVNRNVKIADISKGIVWSVSDHHGHGHHKGAEPELDPHIWTSPKAAKILAKNVAAALSDFDPGNAEFYAENLAAYLATLDSLSSFIETAVARLPEERRHFMVFHPSFGYLARDYGLTQHSVEVDGKEPKPRDLQRLVAEAKARNIRAVFVMPQFSRRAAEQIANSIGGTVAETDPLSLEFEREIGKFIEALAK